MTWQDVISKSKATARRVLRGAVRSRAYIPSRFITQAQIEELRAQIAKTDKIIGQAREQSQTKAARLETWAPLVDYWRANQSILKPSIFAQIAGSISKELAADCYVSLLPIALPAAFELKTLMMGWSCDNVENVEIDRHTRAPNMSAAQTRLVNHSGYGALLASDKLLTIGAEIEKTLARFQRPTMVLENYRYRETVARNNFRGRT